MSITMHDNPEENVSISINIWKPFQIFFAIFFAKTQVRIFSRKIESTWCSVTTANGSNYLLLLWFDDGDFYLIVAMGSLYKKLLLE